MNIWTIAAYFIIYAFIGWCVEVIYATIKTSSFVNRGFLMGPICPIYGAGATLVVLILRPIENNLPVLFLGAVVLTSLIEFFTGLILEIIFHQKWWDYSMRPFNIKGYICLRFSLIWGLACTFVMKVVQPLIDRLIDWLQSSARWKALPVIILLVYGILLADIIVTLIALAKIHTRLRLINDVDRLLMYMSETVGSKLSGETLKGMKEMEKIDQRYESLVAKAKARAGERYLEHIAMINRTHSRLEKAFPNLDFSRFRGIAARIESARLAIANLLGDHKKK